MDQTKFSLEALCDFDSDLKERVNVAGEVDGNNKYAHDSIFGVGWLANTLNQTARESALAHDLLQFVLAVASRRGSRLVSENRSAANARVGLSFAGTINTGQGECLSTSFTVLPGITS